MKKVIYSLLLASLVASSCGKKLDLLPQQSVAEEVALNSDANVKKVLNGAYDALSIGDLYGGNVSLYAELLAADDEIRWEGTFNEPREIWLKQMITTNSFVRDTWIEGYKTINVANNILGAIAVVDPGDQDRVEGEALFIRAAVYFELVKFYAKPYSDGNAASNPGLPLILTPTRGIDASSYVARSTVANTYAQIITDLTEAENLLPEENDVYATKAAAAALLSRVYLQQADYASARDAANRAITAATNAGLTLVSDYADAFNNTENSSEDIFAIQVSDQDGDNSMHLYCSIPDFGGRDGDVSIQQKHLDFYTPGDDRLNLFYVGAGGTRTGKWKQQYRVIPVIRLSEMYLTRAECNFRLGTTVGDTPINDLNQTRSRAGIASPTITLDAILLERKLELAHEGQAVHDLRRLKNSADGFAYNANEMVFPIPQREIDATNGVVVQNPGY